MKQKICTSIEQSKKLIEFGIDVNTADMYIGNYISKSGKVDGTNIHYYIKGESFGAPETIPAWSLTALLNILVKQHFIIQTRDYNSEYHEYQYRIEIPSRHCKIWFSSLLDAVFEMVIWLKENNKL